MTPARRGWARRSRRPRRWPPSRAARAGRSALVAPAAATARRPTTRRRLVPGRRAGLRRTLDRPRPRTRTRGSRALAGALPPLTRLRDQLVAAVAPPPALDVARDVRPWLGDERRATRRSPADSIVLAAVADRPRAQALVARVGDLTAARALPRRAACCAPARPRSPSSATSSRSGRAGACSAAIDLAPGRGRRARRRGAVPRAPRARPPAASLDAYASRRRRARGCSRRGRGAARRCSGVLLDRPGAAARRRAALTAEEPAGCASRRACSRPARRRDAAFEPVLLERVPARRGRLPRRARARAAAGASSPRGSAATRVVGAARAALPRREAGSTSTATCSRRSPARSRSSVTAARAIPAVPAPVVTLKARTRTRRARAAALARLQDPLAARLALPGTVPGVPAGDDRRRRRLHAARHARSSRRPTRSRDGARHLHAPAGLAPAARHAGRRAAPSTRRSARCRSGVDVASLPRPAPAPRARRADRPDAISGFAAARDDLGRVRAVGAVVDQDPAQPTDTTAELFLQIP